MFLEKEQKMTAKTVIVGMSGGVDSALAALLLKEKGFHVIGVSMSIYGKDMPHLVKGGNACFGSEEKEEIKQIPALCHQIGIESHVFDCSDVYHKTIISYFKEEYLKGRTPNPCVMCNATMKFGFLIDKAKEEGISFDYFATGHYARIIQDKSGHFFLKKGIDEKKDQSYFLYRLSQEKLAMTLFPLGGMTKEQVRALAFQKGLSVSDKADSQDFYAGDYSDILQFPPKEGVVMTPEGEILGKHQGYWHFTTGQRKGLGIAYKEPLFVTDVDAHRNIVYVTTKDKMYTQEVFVSDVIWSAFKEPPLTFRAFAKQRSTAKASPVTVFVRENGIQVLYDEPQLCFTAGQSLVLYDEDTVLGGGIIQKG